MTIKELLEDVDFKVRNNNLGLGPSPTFTC